jgi:L-alanine-DL-glutamate epimerase-like enolase superfamily enzyme
MSGPDQLIGQVTTAVYRFPTPEPESDGTLTWDATTAVTVQISAAGHQGLGWTYSAAAAAQVIDDQLTRVITGLDAVDIDRCWSAMHRACRNLGTRGLVMQAISAVDIALWDLKARILGVPLTALFGKVRDTVPVYGSGGFTNLNPTQLDEQIAAWHDAGCTRMKIKIGENWGTNITRDLRRVQQLRKQAGPDVELMVDANGGYTRGQARRVGDRLDDLGVRWFEEPVSSDDPTGLGLLRSALRCDVTAGEYIADIDDAATLSTVVDCLQLDVTRCGGYTGFRRAAAIAQTHHLDVSAHCAPALHAPLGAAITNLRHLEWFTDHARLEPLLVEGTPVVSAGQLTPQTSAPGHGMSIQPAAATFSTR